MFYQKKHKEQKPADLNEVSKWSGTIKDFFKSIRSKKSLRAQFEPKTKEIRDDFFEVVKNYQLDNHYFYIKKNFKNIEQAATTGKQSLDQPNEDMGPMRTDFIGQQIRAQIYKLRGQKIEKNNIFKVKHQFNRSSKPSQTAKIKGCQPNGNCLFEEILYQDKLTDDENTVHEFRQEICQYFQDNVVNFEKKKELISDRVRPEYYNEILLAEKKTQKIIVEELFKQPLSVLKEKLLLRWIRNIVCRC